MSGTPFSLPPDQVQFAQQLAQAQQVTQAATPPAPTLAPQQGNAGPTLQDAAAQVSNAATQGMLSTPAAPAGGVRNLLSNYLGASAASMTNDAGMPTPLQQQQQLQAQQAKAQRDMQDAVQRQTKTFGGRFRTGVQQALGLPTAMEQQAAIQKAGENVATQQETTARTGLINAQASLQPVTINGNTFYLPAAQAATLIKQGMANQGRIENTQVSNEGKANVANINQAGANLRAGYDADNNPLPVSKLAIPQQVKALLSGIQSKLAEARLDAINADPNTPAGRVAIQKLNNATLQARAAAGRSSAALQQAGVASDKYLADYFGLDEHGNALPGLDPDAPVGLNVTKLNQAPSTILQTAMFAQGGLKNYGDALNALHQLKSSGYLNSIPANKLEDALYGAGFDDPRATPEQNRLMGIARTGLSLGDSATLRAHTGRTSVEIFRDLKKNTRIGQNSDVMEGALGQTMSTLKQYAGAASNKNIKALRGGGAAQPAFRVGDPVSIHGKPMKVTAVHSDGSFDAQ